MSSYNKSVLKPVFNMSKDQYTNFDKATPLRKLLGEPEKLAKSTDYTVLSDLKVDHDNTWDDVKRMMVKLHFQHEEENTLPSQFKIEKIDRPNSVKPGYFQVTLPKKEDIIEGDTGKYLVLIAHDKSNVIMPKFYNFLESKLKNSTKRGRRRKIYGDSIKFLSLGTAEIRKYNRKNGTMWIRIQH